MEKISCVTSITARKEENGKTKQEISACLVFLLIIKDRNESRFLFKVLFSTREQFFACFLGFVSDLFSILCRSIDVYTHHHLNNSDDL